MFTRVLGLLYGDVPAQYTSDFSLGESVARLRARTERSAFSSLFHESAVGPVTESRVRLQRVIPYFSNSFKPIFVGAFRQRHGRIVLEGRFTMFLFSKVFMTAWLTGALVWTMLASVAVLRMIRADPGKLGSTTSLVPLIGLAFFVFGIAFVRGCWWLSRKDVLFIAAVIREALSPRSSP